MKKQPEPKTQSGLQRFIETEAHHRLAIAFAIAVLTFGLTSCLTSWSASLILSWDMFAFSSLVLAWLGMFFTDAKSRIREAHLQDSSYSAICCCVVLASVAGLVGAGTLLGSAKALVGIEATKHVLLAVATVFLSWFLVHTMLALHYTHVFYCSCKEAGHGHGVGLIFPGQKEPDYLDFAYFAFVVGMTCQVSDIQVTSRRIRRIVLLHGLLSFAFNAIILAFSINLAATLL